MGKTTIECVHIPGHTPGSMSYFFEICDQGKTYSVGIHGAPGLNTLTDEYLAQYGLSDEARGHYQASLDKLKTRSVDIFIGAHPGQNNTFGKRERMTDSTNPFINGEDWPAFLSSLETNARTAFGY